VFVAIQAGVIQLLVENSDNKELWSRSIKFDKINTTNNIILLKNYTIDLFDHIKIRITALENSDYSIYSVRKASDQLPDNELVNYVEVGRPIYLYIYDNSVECFDGQFSNDAN
jgi:hypothetical protein